MTTIFNGEWYQTVPINFYEFRNDLDGFITSNKKFGLSDRLKITCDMLGIERDTKLRKIL